MRQRSGLYYGHNPIAFVMEYSQGSLGRVFVIRLSEGEVLIGWMDRFLAEKEVASWMILFLG
ncbi:MAG: hypothetical protein WBK88_00425, partial [Methanothrix sp.]